MTRETDPATPTNRLIHEASPYLVQHARNPVDWYPYGPEALARARAEDKPVFLSIGYSACHWCHVMERESFENKEVADLLNGGFVSIKVDREERPDLDDVYMSAVQMMTGSGGWPMSVFLTPELKPFFAGTYFPPDDRYGRPGFPRLLRAILESWSTRRQQLEDAGDRVADEIRTLAKVPPGSGLLTREPIEAALESLGRSFDRVHGGFGSAPKFPHAMAIRLLLREHQRNREPVLLERAVRTLDGMAEGGIYDHLGGGFHRYSVDAEWLVPHFEKMLYDQAQLALAGLEAFQHTGEARFARVARETIDYVLRDLSHADGGCFSSEDADSEGEEGRFYVWSPAEIEALLGESEASLVCRAYDVSPHGNFEGHSILRRIATDAALGRELGEAPDRIEARLAASRARLFAERAKRARPFRDEKVILAWNGLMLECLARAARVLAEPRYEEAAVRVANFLFEKLCPGGRWHRIWKDGRITTPAFLDDYANLASGLVELYEATFDGKWLDRAVAVAEEMQAHFGDPAGGFLFSANHHDGLIARTKSAEDGSVPSGNSMAATVLLRLSWLTGREEFERLGVDTLRAFQRHLERAPGAFHQMLLALDLYLGPRNEIVLVGNPEAPETRALGAELRRRFLPRAVLSGFDPASKRGPETPLHQGKDLVRGRAAAYVCTNFACAAPELEPEAFGRALDALAQASSS